MSDDLMTVLGDEKFVLLTTYRRDGSPVGVPMWIARDGEHLLAWTPADSWKVKRLRRDARVALTPCTRMGKVSPAAAVLHGSAVVVTDDAEVARAAARIKAKYGLQFRLITAIEALLSRGRKPRVALLISSAS